MPNYNCSPLTSTPGIQRDGTLYASSSYIDGQWVRFYLDKARKIGGYNCVSLGTEIIIRNMFSVPDAQTIDLYIGRFNSVSYVTLPINDRIDVSAIYEIDRTPTDLVASADNAWSFDLYTSYSTIYPNPQIIAQVCSNADSINNSIDGNIYYGDITTNDRLEKITDSYIGDIKCSGGIVFIPPLLVAYGNNGQIIWNNPDVTDPLNTWTTTVGNVPLTAIIANTKIVYGTSVVGAQIPTGLFWSLNGLIRASYTPVTDATTNVTTYAFSSTPIETNISIISARCVVNYKQTYYWIGIDQFYMFDGVVRPLPNTMNRDWFFNNVNLLHRNKIFGVAVPRYDEIWWHFCSGNSEEPNEAIVYNVAGNFWYDTRSNRSCGIQTSLFPKPLFADSSTTPINTRIGVQNNYLVWEHETGYDSTIANLASPIFSSFSHHFIDLCAAPLSINLKYSSGLSENRLLRNRRIEPNFNMIGNMSVSITNLKYASDVVNGTAEIEGPYPFDGNTRYIDTASQGRLVSLNFVSNELGGYFQEGKTLYDWEVGDIQT